MKIDTKKGYKDTRKNGHTAPTKKSKCWGLSGTSKYDSDSEQVVWENFIQYFYDKGIHDYRYLIK